MVNYLVITPILKQPKILRLFFAFIGYEFGDMDPDEMVKLLDKVDMTKNDQFDQVIDIVGVIVNDAEITTEFGNKYDTTESTLDEPQNGGSSGQVEPESTTSSSTTSTSTTSASEDEVKDQAEKVTKLLNVALSITNIDGLATSLKRFDFETRFVSEFMKF